MKKRIAKRWLSLLLVLVMVFSMGTTAFAEETTDSSDEETSLTVTFVTDEHTTVDIYYNKDNYSQPDETNVSSAYVRGKGSAEIDNSGSGQVNFRVNVTEGYTYDVTVTPDGNYNSCKGEEETGVANIWRITKISGNLTVTITSNAEGGTGEPAEDISIAEQSSISLTVGADETQRNFTWYCNTNQVGVLYLAKSSEVVDGSLPENAQVYTADVSAATNKSGYYSNQVTVMNLETGTTYAYQLVNGETKSEVMTFTTGSEGAFSFAFVADPQIGASGNATSDSDGWDKSLSIIAENSIFGNVAFMLSAGDQVNTANNETEYDGYLDHEELYNLPVATVIGNHDTNSAAYSEHFNNPNVSSSYGVTAAGSDYYFVYNNVLFMVLNSNNTSTAEHKAFMEQAIEATADQNITWKIVTFHHSIYSVASHATETSIISLREQLVPVFKELDIDVVLMGHDHVYCRSYMMDGLTAMTDASLYDDESYSSITDPTGILYITANSASGSKYYNIQNNVEFTYSAVMNQERVPNVSKIDISDTQFTITTYRTNDMTVVDTFTIYRTETHTHTEGETVIENRVEPTCTETGSYDEVTYCTECNEEISRTTVTVEATGHTWGEWTTVVSPTCSDMGSEQRICTVCGIVETRDVDASGHDWESDYTIDKEATCTTDGSKSIHCKNCDVVKDSITIPATGHNYQMVESSDGTVTYTCTICGDSYSETVSTGNTSSTDNTNTTETTSTTTGGTTSPKTGDESKIWVYVIMMLAAGSGCIVIGTAQRRKRFYKR